jgi:ProP effector
MTSPTLPAETKQDARGLLKSLQEKYPVFGKFKPLAIGIDKQLLERETGVDRKTLRLALGMHTHSFRYLKSMEKADRRFDLDGNPAGEVPEEHRQHAADILRERAKKEAERREAERMAREAAVAEKQRMEKLNQLVQKFAK